MAFNTTFDSCCWRVVVVVELGCVQPVAFNTTFDPGYNITTSVVVGVDVVGGVVDNFVVVAYLPCAALGVRGPLRAQRILTHPVALEVRYDEIVNEAATQEFDFLKHIVSHML